MRGFGGASTALYLFLAAQSVQAGPLNWSDRIARRAEHSSVNTPASSPNGETSVAAAGATTTPHPSFSTLTGVSAGIPSSILSAIKTARDSDVGSSASPSDHLTLIPLPDGSGQPVGTETQPPTATSDVSSAAGISTQSAPVDDPATSQPTSDPLAVPTATTPISETQTSAADTQTSSPSTVGPETTTSSPAAGTSHILDGTTTDPPQPSTLTSDPTMTSTNTAEESTYTTDTTTPATSDLTSKVETTTTTPEPTSTAADGEETTSPLSSQTGSSTDVATTTTPASSPIASDTPTSRASGILDNTSMASFSLSLTVSQSITLTSAEISSAPAETKSPETQSLPGQSSAEAVIPPPKTSTQSTVAPPVPTETLETTTTPEQITSDQEETATSIASPSVETTSLPPVPTEAPTTTTPDAVPQSTEPETTFTQTILDPNAGNPSAPVGPPTGTDLPAYSTVPPAAPPADTATPINNAPPVDTAAPPPTTVDPAPITSAPAAGIPTVINSDLPKGTSTVPADAYAQNLQDAKGYNKAFEALTPESACTSKQVACIDGKVATCQGTTFNLKPCPAQNQRCFALPSTDMNAVIIGCKDVDIAEGILAGSAGSVPGTTPGSGDGQAATSTMAAPVTSAPEETTTTRHRTTITTYVTVTSPDAPLVSTAEPTVPAAQPDKQPDIQPSDQPVNQPANPPPAVTSAPPQGGDVSPPPSVVTSAAPQGGNSNPVGEDPATFTQTLLDPGANQPGISQGAPDGASDTVPTAPPPEGGEGDLSSGPTSLRLVPVPDPTPTEAGIGAEATDDGGMPPEATAPATLIASATDAPAPNRVTTSIVNGLPTVSLFFTDTVTVAAATVTVTEQAPRQTVTLIVPA